MFLDMTLGSLWRHKARSVLTITGIVLAIAAIVSLGSISEGINSLATEQMSQASDFIMVMEKGAMDIEAGGLNFGTHVRADMEDDILQIEGVEDVVLEVEQMDIKTHLFILGFELDKLDMFGVENIRFIEGDWPEPGEKSLVLGYQVAESRGFDVGEEIIVNGDEYFVRGILEEMKGSMDYAAITSVEAAQDTFDMEEYATAMFVEASDVRDMGRITSEIEERFDDVEALTTEEAMEIAQDMINQIRVITLAVGVVASLVASIGIINTMMMVVATRKQEFGIMKALGAERKVVLTIVLQEGLMLAVVGGIVGLLLGIAGTEALNQSLPMPMASVTPALAILSFLYGIILAVVASLYPAYQAINVDPAEAMHSE
jgi:putative ABC transport system permease protein